MFEIVTQWNEPNLPLISRSSADWPHGTCAWSSLKLFLSARETSSAAPKPQKKSVKVKKKKKNPDGTADLRAVKCAADWKLGGVRTRNAADYSKEFQRRRRRGIREREGTVAPS